MHTSFEILVVPSSFFPTFWLDFLDEYFEVQMGDFKFFLIKIKLAKKPPSI